MSTTATVRARRDFRRLPKTYEGLVKLLPPRPIHDDEDLANAMRMIDRLAGFNLNADQEDYLETLAVLVEAYEAEHHEIDTSGITPLDVLKHLLAANGMNGADLGRLLGNEPSLGGKILRGERQLSKAHMRKLGERFKVNPGLFLGTG